MWVFKNLFFYILIPIDWAQNVYCYTQVCVWISVCVYAGTDYVLSVYTNC